VTTLLLALAVLFVYGVWKFVPPFMQALEVDESLSRVKYEAARLPWEKLDSRVGEDMLARCEHEIEELGVDPDTLEVYFSPDFHSVHADYTAVLTHPLVGTTTLKFHREQEIRRDDL
jgi:hypothetical protein